MIQIMMAVALFILALARIPAVRRNGNDPVFLAAVFAGTSSLLLSPVVYYPVDRILGGISLTKLALNSSMIVGLWCLRKAVVAAVSPRADTRAPWTRTLPMSLTLSVQAAFFFLAGIGTSTLAWVGDGRHPIQVGLFAVTMIAFIAWCCGEIAWTCFRFVPRMRRSFRLGFSMVGTGSLLAVAIMVIMGTGELAAAVQPGSDLDKAIKALPFHLLEMIAVLLVGVGLTIPALAGRAIRRKAALRRDRTIARVEAIRSKALKHTDMGRILKQGDLATSQERLHRMIVEIWDAELAAGTGRSVLAPEDRDYLLLVEKDFNLERTH